MPKSIPRYRYTDFGSHILFILHNLLAHRANKQNQIVSFVKYFFRRIFVLCSHISNRVRKCMRIGLNSLLYFVSPRIRVKYNQAWTIQNIVISSATYYNDNNNKNNNNNTIAVCSQFERSALPRRRVYCIHKNIIQQYRYIIR